MDVHDEELVALARKVFELTPVGPEGFATMDFLEAEVRLANGLNQWANVGKAVRCPEGDTVYTLEDGRLVTYKLVG